MSTDPAMPTVTWGGHTISRLLIGHNPFKGGSHVSKALDAEMREWHADIEQSAATLRRCEEVGITCAQFGGEWMHRILAEHKRRGGSMQWIATFYSNEKGNLAFGQKVAFEEDLEQILVVDPPPIGIQHFGENTDRLFFDGRLADVRERMKRLRDTGRLTGGCSHLPAVVA